MADSLTDYLGLTKPEVGASPDTWGDKLNADLDDVDAAIQDLSEAPHFGVASGADVIAVTLSPALSAYANGAQVRFKAAGTNSTGVTLNVNGLGAKDVKYPDGSSLPAGALVGGIIYNVDYNGSYFVLSSLVTASAAETKGSTSTKPITPASAAVTAGEWAVGGLYIKWGTISVATSANGGGTAVNFTTAFPSSCDMIQVSRLAPSGSQADVIFAPWYKDPSTAGFTAGVDRDFGADTTFTVSWLAIGR